MIHFVFIVAQLKSTLSSFADFYRCYRIISSNSVYMKDDIAQIKSYKLKKIINSRETVTKEIKYLIKWKDCKSEQNMWRNLSKIRNAINIMKKYHRVMNVVVSNRYRRLLKSSSLLKEHFSATETVLSKLMIIILIIASTSISRSQSSSKIFVSLRRFSRLLSSI